MLHPVYCTMDNLTTVFCHINSVLLKGVGSKAPDWAGFYGCFNCHTAYDTGKLDDINYILTAWHKTLKILVEEKIISIQIPEPKSLHYMIDFLKKQF